MFDFSIREILPHVYRLHFHSSYDLAMHFLRFQEYYESPRYYKQIFSLVDYMEWYSKEHGHGKFTYADDWSGFNVPSWALRDVRWADIPDPNKYDRLMFSLVDWVEQVEHPKEYYFIGTSDEGHREGETADDILDHEVAHALYTVNSQYRKNVNRLLGDWDGPGGHKGEELDSARTVLRSMGYHETTVEDEIHAYCATGLCDELKGVISKREMKPFQKLFKEYKAECKSEM